jgi:putative hydrolase of the HAD superfamily
MILYSAVMDKTPLLLIDADDTLWESALYFRRAEEDFVSLLESLGQNPDEVIELVHSRDIQRLSHTGYGAVPYMDTLSQVMDELHPSAPPWAVRCLDSIRSNLLSHPLVLLPGVRKTLTLLSEEGLTTVVYTMGRRGHQMDKFLRSGLKGDVDGLRILERKTASSLREILEGFGADPRRTAVIGNSPRSDIHPALEVGVNAVYVHRPGTWVAEHAELPESANLVEVASFDGVPWALMRLGLLEKRVSEPSCMEVRSHEDH